MSLLDLSLDEVKIMYKNVRMGKEGERANRKKIVGEISTEDDSQNIGLLAKTIDSSTHCTQRVAQSIFRHQHHDSCQNQEQREKRNHRQTCTSHAYKEQ